MTSRKKTHEQYEAEFNAIFNGEYKLSSKYEGAHSKVLVKHEVCGKERLVVAGSALRGKGCRCVSNTKNAAERNELLAELLGDMYTIITGYTKAREKVTLLHKGCMNEYEVTYDSARRGTRCPYCCGNLKKTTDEVRRRMHKITDGEYSLLGDYVRSLEYVSVQHNSCGRIYNVTPNAFFNSGHRCKPCQTLMVGTGNTKTTEEFAEELNRKYHGEFSLLNEYKNSKTKIHVRHNNCGHKYRITPNKLLGRGTCPKCKMSVGERAVDTFLINNEISYIREYRVKNVKGTSLIRYDFSILNDDRSISAMIEYDGEQHYRPVTFGGISEERAQVNFEKQQRRDAIKTKYCADNNIPLIRIPYWEYDNIDAILTEKLLPLLYNADKRNAS